jgi:hypothetical protein
MSPPVRDRLVGSIIAGAIGDALGVELNLLTSRIRTWRRRRVRR